MTLPTVHNECFVKFDALSGSTSIYNKKYPLHITLVYVHPSEFTFINKDQEQAASSP